MLNKLFPFGLLGIISFIHVLVFTKLIYFPYPELFVYPYLTNHGLKPYSQILDQHFPGLMFLPINLDNLGMNNEQSARIYSLAIIILIHIALFVISYKILKSKSKALLVNCLFLLWNPFFEGWVLWIDSFLPLILLPNFYFLYKRNLFLSGLLLGIGVVFKQTLIPLAILVIIYLWWQNKRLKDALTFLEGLAIPVVLMIIYFFSIGVIKDFWYWTVIFNLTTYAKFGTSAPVTIGFVTRVLVVYLPSLLLCLYKKDKRLVQILFIFLVGSLIGVFDRADFIHFQPSLPFALLATTLGLFSIRRNNLLKMGLIFYIFITLWWQRIFYTGHISSKVLLFDDNTKMIAQKIRQYTEPSEKIFIFGVPPHLYQMADRLPSGNIFVFQFPWFLKIAEPRILTGIISDKPNIIVSERNAQIEGLQIKDFAPEIDSYIQQNYQVVERVGPTDIMRRKIP